MLPAMDLEQLCKPDLLLICEELGIDVRKIQRKPLLLKAIQASGADAIEIVECWELIEERKAAREAEREAEAEKLKAKPEAEEIRLELEAEEKRTERKVEKIRFEAEEKRAEREAEKIRLELEAKKLRAEHDMEMKRMELEMRRLEIEQNGRQVAKFGEVKTPRIKDLLQSFRIGDDVGLFLVNLERTCERMEWSRDTWPQLFLTLLPCEAAQVIARLSVEEAADYEAVKLSLQKKYHLSKEAFRQRFREAKKRPDESYRVCLQLEL